MCDIFLLIESVERSAFYKHVQSIIIAHEHGWLLEGTSQDVYENNIFEHKTQKPQKMLIIRENGWRDVGRPLSCNAFAIARFVVFFCFLHRNTQQG